MSYYPEVNVYMPRSVKCPVCGYEFEDKPLKTWKFRFYKVSRFECEKCGVKFNVYESSKSRFTIPKSKRK